MKLWFHCVFKTTESWFCCVKKLPTLNGLMRKKRRGGEMREEGRKVAGVVKEEEKSERGREKDWSYSKKGRRVKWLNCYNW